jgi:hypothetical protein
VRQMGSRVLDPHDPVWDGGPLAEDNFVLSADPASQRCSWSRVISKTTFCRAIVRLTGQASPLRWTILKM